MEAEQRACQARAQSSKAVIEKRVGEIVAEFERKTDEDGVGRDLEKGRKAGELLNLLQEHGEKRCEEIMNVERWHEENAALGDDARKGADDPQVLEFLQRPEEEKPGDTHSNMVSGLDMTDPDS